MFTKGSCKNCVQSNDCQKIYEAVGNCKGPSILSNVFTAFLLPIVVFVGALAVLEIIFDKVIDAESLRIFLNFTLALSVTFIFMLTLKAVKRIINKTK